MHPPCSEVTHAIPFGTGSLGHGLCLAWRDCVFWSFTGKSLKVFAVLSDGDCNEGSTWEGASVRQSAEPNWLDLLLFRGNGVQGIGYIEEESNLGTNRR